MSSSLWRSEGSKEAADGVGMAAGIALYDIIILELLEQTDLPNSGARDAFVFCFEPNLLEGNDFV